jgi:hypothetical protein
MSASYCWWSIGDGAHGKMLRLLAKSMKKHNIDGDIHFWTDRSDIPEVEIHNIGTDSFNKQHYMFKFEFLRSEVAKLPYDYFIFLDADSYAVNELPYNPILMMQGSPIHSFLESYTSNIKNRRFDWWGCWIPYYEELMREKGVVSSRIYNVNAGFWIVQREAIECIYSLANEFWRYCKSKNVIFTEEAPLAYVTHMLCGDAENHTLLNFTDMWASDWTGEFNNRLPEYRTWNFEEYFTGEKIPVKPSIVHCMRSKNALIGNNL